LPPFQSAEFLSLKCKNAIKTMDLLWIILGHLQCSPDHIAGFWEGNRREEIRMKDREGKGRGREDREGDRGR